MKKILSVCLFIFLFSAAGVAVSVARPATIAVAPFDVASESGLDYLKTGIIDLFSSRLSVENKVVVLDKVKVTESLKGKGELTEKTAIDAAVLLGADYILFGSIDESPKGITINSFVVNSDGKTAVLEFPEKSSKYEDSDVIIRLVNRISINIKKDIFNLDVEKPDQVKPVVESKNTHAHPDTLLKELRKDSE